MAKKPQTTAPVSIFDRLYDRPWKHMVAVAVGLTAAYFSALWAIDSGRLLVYALTAVLFVASLRHVAVIVKSLYAK